MWPFSAHCPKCLLALGTSTILEHQLRNLAAAGVHRVVVVAGHGYDRLRRVAARYAGPLEIAVLYNPFYQVADNLLSLWAARAEMHDDFLLMNGDNVFHPGILCCLAEASGDACLAVNRKAAFDDDDAKVQLNGQRVERIGKDLPPEKVDAESIGIMRFVGPAAPALHQVLEEAAVCKQARYRLFLHAIQMLIDTGSPVYACDVGDLPWADVDTPDDLRHVRAHLERYTAPAGHARHRARSAP